MVDVLIVDDDPNVALLVKMTLSKEPDFKIDIAENGEIALEKIASNLPDIVLLDIMMPGIDGLEVCKRVKSDEKTKFIPVIMLTAKREMGDMIRGMEIGANDYITKPFNPEELLARVRVHLRIKTLEKEAAAIGELETLLKMSVTLQHEINNPLTGVIGNAELLKDWESLSKEDVDEAISGILSSSLRIKEIVKQMGNLNHISSTTYVGSQEMIDLSKSADKRENKS